MRKILFLYLAFLSSLGLFAQTDEAEDVSVNRQFWFDVNGKFSLVEHLTLDAQTGYRSINPHVYDKYHFVPTLNIAHNKSPKFMKLKKPLINSFHLGSGLFYTNNYDGSDSNMELRLVQGFRLFFQPEKFIPLKTYFRLEERFQKDFGSESNWETSVRVRLRFSTVIEWQKHLFSFNKGLYIPISIEFFFNMQDADRYNDVIRISPGIGYKLNDFWKFELYGSYHYSNNTTEDQNSTNDFVFRLRIYRSYLKKEITIDTKEEEIKELIE